MQIRGNKALQLAREVSKVPDGYFNIAFYNYSKIKGAGNSLKVYKRCRTRKQLPEEMFSIASDNFFLFSDADGNPRMCYRYLIRYMSFPQDRGILRKLIWIE